MKQGQEHMLRRILHALRQTLSLYPTEGLLTLEPLLDCFLPTVRERLIRVLAEGYALNPELVTRFVWQHGEKFSDEETQEIFRDREPDLDQHPITILEWGRVYRFLMAIAPEPEQWRFVLSRINQAKCFSSLVQPLIEEGRQTRCP